MGIVSNFIPRVLDSFFESSMLPIEEYREGIVIPITFSFPRASFAMQQVTAESIPPDSPSITFLNPHL